TNAASYRLSFKVSHAPYLFGMVGWWPFDMDLLGILDTSDIFGGHDGHAVGDVAVEIGEVAEAFSSDGIYTSVKVPRCPELDLGQAGRGFSIEGWIRPALSSTNLVDTFYVSSAGNDIIEVYNSGGGAGGVFGDS